MFTPTPAVRPRARFNISPPQELYTEDIVQIPLMPYTRGRSSLFSVFNPTVPPRLKVVSAPHRLHVPPVADEMMADGQATPASTIHKAFAGITPRPRRGRISYAHAQTYMRGRV